MVAYSVLSLRSGTPRRRPCLITLKNSGVREISFATRTPRGNVPQNLETEKIEEKMSFRVYECSTWKPFNGNCRNSPPSGAKAEIFKNEGFLRFPTSFGSEIHAFLMRRAGVAARSEISEKIFGGQKFYQRAFLPIWPRKFPMSWLFLALRPLSLA